MAGFCLTSAAIRSFAGAKRRQNLSRTGAEQDSILLPPLAPRAESEANEEVTGPRRSEGPTKRMSRCYLSPEGQGSEATAELIMRGLVEPEANHGG